MTCITITAMYSARFHIVYTQPYTEDRARRLNEIIRECAQDERLDDEKTIWFGHSKAINGTYASAAREAVEQAAAKLEAAIKHVGIARLLTVEEWEAHVADVKSRTHP